jgi:23S rRNA (guanosine2251-2'-O)-methyltransferase
MVERSQRGKGKQKLLGSHNRCWVWGRNAVLETLRAGRWPILELHLSAALDRPHLQAARRLAEAGNVPIQIVADADLTRLCRSSEHQGYVARMPPYPYAAASELLALTTAQPVFVILDSIQDPYNFGAILRSADALGVQGVFVAETGQADVNSLVVRSSAGAVNHLSIAQVPNLTELARQLAARGVLLVAASEKSARDLFDSDFRQPVAVVIGNEGRGIHADLLAQCHEQVRIPQAGHVSSLNAAVAAGILFYEIRRQRMQAK